MKRRKKKIILLIIFSVIIGTLIISVTLIYKNKENKPYIEIKNKTLIEIRKDIEYRDYNKAEGKINSLLNNKIMQELLCGNEKFILYDYLGIINLQQGKFLNAIVNYEKANKYADKSNKLKSLINIAISYRNIGEYVKSSEMLIKISKGKIYDRQENAYIKAYSLLNLAEIHLRVGNFREFKNVLDNSYQYINYISPEYKDDILIIYYTYVTLDNINNGKLDEAEKCLSKIKELQKRNKRIDFTELEVLRLRAIANFYLKKGEDKKSEEYFKKLEIEAHKEGEMYLELEALGKRIDILKKINKQQYIRLLKKYYDREEEIEQLDNSQCKYHLNNKFIEEINNSMNKELWKSILILTVLFCILVFLLVKKVSKSEKESMKDPLCDIYNRRFLNNYMEKINKKDIPISILMIDVDYFKLYNDNYGHQKGDLVLKTVANVLKRSCRKGDVVARYGGEEFCIVLKKTSKEEAIDIARKIKYNINKENISHNFSNVEKFVTLSIGIANIYSLDHLGNLIKLADKALYGIKNSGRNGYIHIEDMIKEGLVD